MPTKTKTQAKPKKISVARPKVVTSNSAKSSSSFLGKKASRWTVVAAFVVIFGGVGSYFLFQSHADTVDEHAFPLALKGGTCLTAGKTVYENPNPAGSARLTMQKDGNAVVYNEQGKAVWATGSNGTGSSNRLCMQTDGNLVVYNGANQVLRTTNTDGLAALGYTSASSNYELDFTEPVGVAGTDGVAIRLQAPVGAPILAWVSYRRTSINLIDGDLLARGQAIYSPNGVYTAVLQTDGNFVVYHGSKPIWASHTYKKTTISALGQSEDLTQLQLVDSSGSALWSGAFKSYPSPALPELLTMQNDGNLVVYLDNGKPIWATGTNGK